MKIRTYGGLYRESVDEQRDNSTEDLNAVVEAYRKKSLIGQVACMFNPFDCLDVRVAAASDILATRKDPQGTAARRVSGEIQVNFR